MSTVTQLIDDFVNKNPSKYNEFIQRIGKYKPGREIDIEIHILLQLIYNYIITHENLLDTIYPEYRITFIEQCSEINRQTFLYSLKIGKEKAEQARNKEGIISSISMEKEIEIIDSYLSNNGNKKIYRTIDNIVNRAFMHSFNELGKLDEDEISEILNNAIPVNYSQHISFVELKNEVFNNMSDYKVSFSAEIAKHNLFYFNDAIPIEDIEYECFYKPFFLALTDYKEYLRELVKAKDSKHKVNIIKFSPIDGDFREGYKGYLSYDDIKDIERFKYLEELLYGDKLIDKDYNFIKAKGNKNDLAAIYKFIIREGYFRKNNYKRRDNFQEYHYRQYLDHRYNVDTKQQFKKITDEQVKLILQSKQFRYNFNKLVITNFFSL